MNIKVAAFTVSEKSIISENSNIVSANDYVNLLKIHLPWR